MKCRSAVAWSGAFLAIALIFTGSAAAQRIHGAKTVPRIAAYDISREVTLVGAVQNFSENSDALPLGAHVLLQTASGAVDVHLGPARFLQLNHFTVAEGATLRVIGQMSATSNGNAVFLARIVQQGTQALAVRSNKGIPLAAAGLRASPAATAQSVRGGAR